MSRKFTFRFALTSAEAETGPGFVAPPEGAVVTDDHAVSKIALEQGVYMLELATTRSVTPQRT
jgi:hypothetical protein